MANVRNANTFYVDTQYVNPGDELSGNNIMVHHIVACGDGGTGSFTLLDYVSGQKKFHAHIPANSTVQFSFEEVPILFPTGIKPSVITNCILTLVVKEQSK